MQTSTFADQVRAFVKANYMLGQNDELQDDQSFLDSGIIDSTGVLELVAFLEEQFGINVEDEELTPDNLDSVNVICAYLERKLGVNVGSAAVAAASVVQA